MAGGGGVSLSGVPVSSHVSPKLDHTVSEHVNSFTVSGVTQFTIVLPKRGDQVSSRVPKFQVPSCIMGPFLQTDLIDCAQSLACVVTGRE